jgi:hypothetical protein
MKSIPKLRSACFDGIVMELQDDKVVVLLSRRGVQERRIMSARLLRDSGIAHEGQPFRLRVKEVVTTSGRELVTAVSPAPPAKQPQVPVREQIHD